MRCKHCGNEVKSDYKFCPFCASRLIQDFEGHFEDLEPLVLSEDPVQWEILYDESPEAEQPASAISPSKEYVSQPPQPQQELKTEKKPQPAERPYQIYRPAGQPLEQAPPVPQESQNIPEPEPDLVTFTVPKSSDAFHQFQPNIKKTPHDMDDERVSNAPYVSMKPETAPMPPTYQAGPKRPGPVFKALFILFIVLAALLTSVAVYWLASGGGNAFQAMMGTASSMPQEGEFLDE